MEPPSGLSSATEELHRLPLDPQFRGQCGLDGGGVYRMQVLIEKVGGVHLHLGGHASPLKCGGEWMGKSLRPLALRKAGALMAHKSAELACHRSLQNGPRAFATIFSFITSVDPVCIYGSRLSLLGLLTVGAVPGPFTSSWIGWSVAILIFAATALSTLRRNWGFYSELPARIEIRDGKMQEDHRIAGTLLDAGVRYIHDPYCDAIPVGYTSGLQLPTISNHYNRFPVSIDEKLEEAVGVSVPVTREDPWSDEGPFLISGKCQLTSVMVKELAIVVSPPQALQETTK